MTDVSSYFIGQESTLNEFGKDFINKILDEVMVQKRKASMEMPFQRTLHFAKEGDLKLIVKVYKNETFFLFYVNGSEIPIEESKVFDWIES